MMQCIQLYTIALPCQPECNGSPAGAVILIAADLGNVVLDNHGSEDWKRKEAAERHGPRRDPIT